MFGDVKMFYRAAGWGVALLMLVSPAASSVETDTFVGAIAPPASVALGVMQDQIQIQPGDQANDRSEDTTKGQRSEQTESPAHNDIQAPAKLSSLDPAEPLNDAPVVSEPFGFSAVPVVDGEVLTKWSGVEADIRSDNAVLDRCQENFVACPAAARKFLAIIAEGRAQSGRARVGVINRAINFAIRPMSDLAQWGVPDRWSSPLETFTTGRGDCEDYAIAKYVALMRTGVPAEDLRLVIVHDLTVKENHAVVAVRLDGDWFMLDNRWLTLVADVDVPRTIPLFVLGRDGVKEFTYVAASGARRAAVTIEDAASAPGALQEH
jgi:predicted transglutaminase-like cysteine proteinase